MAGAASDAWQLKWVTLPKASSLRPLSAGVVMSLPQEPDFSPPTTCLLGHVKAGRPVLLNASGSLKVRCSARSLRLCASQRTTPPHSRLPRTTTHVTALPPRVCRVVPRI